MGYRARPRDKKHEEDLYTKGQYENAMGRSHPAEQETGDTQTATFSRHIRPRSTQADLEKALR